MSKEEFAKRATALLSRALINRWQVLEVTAYDPQERDDIELAGNAEADLKRLFEEAYKADPEFERFGRTVKECAEQNGLLCENITGDWYLLSGKEAALRSAHDALSPRHISNIMAVEDFLGDFADRIEYCADHDIGWTPPASTKN